MDSGLLELIRVFLMESWKFITSVTIPGTNFTVAAMIMGVSLIALGFKVLSMILGLSFGGGESYRSQSRKGKISNERAGDER